MDMDEDQLDTLCLSDDIGSIDCFNDELICSTMRGRFRSNRRTVPRLPLAAMISRMKLLEDSSNENGPRAKGRAKLLSDRARHSRQPGHLQRKLVDQQKPLPAGRKMKSKQAYHTHWQEEEFPSLGFEHTVEGSPTKKLRSYYSHSEKQGDKNEEDNKSDIHISTPKEESFEKELTVPRNVVKTKTKIKKEVFDFTKANQSLLEEFPFPKQSGCQVLSLTQHNLEKFLRESDNESNCSTQDPVVHDHVKEFEDDDVPLYQKYAVTLDDIMRSRYTQVPFNLKGPLATLLNTTDTYHTNPNDYFDKTDAHHLAPEAEAEPTVEKKVSCANSTNSVAADISDLNSPSDNEEEMEDSELIDNSYSKRMGPKFEQDVQICKEDIKQNVDAKKSKDLPSIIIETSNSFSSGCGKSDNMVNIEDEQIEKIAEYEGESSEVSKKDSSDIKSVKPVGDLGWTLHGSKVIQIDGLPAQFDEKVLSDYVIQFGIIKDLEIQLIDGCSSLRYRLDSEDACDYAVQCLHGSDCIYPDANNELSCYHLKKSCGNSH